MSTPARDARVNNAIQVIQQVNDGLTVTDACREVGIPRSTFYYTINANPEAIAEYNNMIAANAREQLALVLLSRRAILEKVVQDGLAEDTSPRDRLQILKALDSLLDDAVNKLQVDTEAEEKAQEFMRQGPAIRRQVSRMTAGTIDIEDQS
jgi:ACT domain-containing protein